MRCMSSVVRRMVIINMIDASDMCTAHTAQGQVFKFNMFRRKFCRLTSIERGCRHFLLFGRSWNWSQRRHWGERILAVNLRATRAFDDSKFAWARKGKIYAARILQTGCLCAKDTACISQFYQNETRWPEMCLCLFPEDNPPPKKNWIGEGSFSSTI